MSYPSDFWTDLPVTVPLAPRHPPNTRGSTLYRKLAYLGGEIASGLAQAAMIIRHAFVYGAPSLESIRAEYAAPLGSSSLVVNFLFARFLVSTPVTNIYIQVSPTPSPSVLSRSSIVAFSTINGGFSDESDLTHAPTAPKDDETIAQTLGIECACCWGDIAEGCVVFAKWSLPCSSSGSCCTRNRIICLSRDFEVLDCTLVTLISYSMHAATGLPNIRPSTNCGSSTSSSSPSSPSHRVPSSHTRNLEPEPASSATARLWATGYKTEDCYAEEEDGAEGEIMTLRRRGILRPTLTLRNSRDVLSALVSIANTGEAQAGEEMCLWTLVLTSSAVIGVAYVKGGSNDLVPELR
ncbi:hypothetical protein FIBSPDRAFT_886651 [Athelia psychrophila]|uniref:Uncharacterized protein n=1 Tax=Athelia psychrophila TaxID=1759441 RepID=A0A166QQN8_9AGAM|nr:hypothetical protein FIBSPDRAFT_886651 [Fibularhizoctonia sp. CBS 109695]